jgi:hypothetical protein
MGHKNNPPRPRPGQSISPEDARQNPPSPIHSKARVSFEYYETGEKYCLCHLNRDQITSFLDCLRKLTERTWQQLVDGASKTPSNKTGLNCTQYNRSDLKNPRMWPKQLGPDVDILLGVRATQRRRIYGVRIQGVFYVLWFDEEHGVVKG